MRQAAFFYPDVDALDSRFNVDKDVVGGKLVREDEGDAEEVEEKAVEEEKDSGAAVVGEEEKGV